MSGEIGYLHIPEDLQCDIHIPGSLTISNPSIFRQEAFLVSFPEIVAFNGFSERMASFLSEVPHASDQGRAPSRGTSPLTTT